MEGDSTDIIEDLTSPATGTNNVPQFITPEDPLFNIITSTERYGGAWVKHNDENFCNDCENGMDISR